MCQCENKKPLQVKIKKLHDLAVIPKYAKVGDAGMDMTCVDINYTDDYVEFVTGIAMEIPVSHVGILFPRSSNSKQDLLMTNSCGIIDSSYRGSINFRYKAVRHGEHDGEFKMYSIGDRVGQIIIMPYPQIQFEEVVELETTERGENGFGHSGN